MPVNVRVPIEVAEPLRAQTVLLVSADADWRADAERVLAHAGYLVITARHAGQALVESARCGSVDIVVAEGEFARGRSSLPRRIFSDHPRAKILHLPTRPRTSDDLVAFLTASLK